MSEMSKELKDRYLDEANKHAHFLTEKVFKPAFIMAFIHGAKHGRDDLLKEQHVSDCVVFSTVGDQPATEVFIGKLC